MFSYIRYWELDKYHYIFNFKNLYKIHIISKSHITLLTRKLSYFLTQNSLTVYFTFSWPFSFLLKDSFCILFTTLLLKNYIFLRILASCFFYDLSRWFSAFGWGNLLHNCNRTLRSIIWITTKALAKQQFRITNGHHIFYIQSNVNYCNTSSLNKEPVS